MRDSRQVHAKALGDGGIRVTLVHFPSDEPRQVERRQPVALLVLGDLRVRVRRGIADNDRDFQQPNPSSCPPPLGTEVDSVSAGCVRRVNDDGLQNAVLSDVLGKFVEVGLRKLGARVVGVFVQQVDVQHQGQAFNGVRNEWIAALHERRHNRLESSGI